MVFPCGRGWFRILALGRNIHPNLPAASPPPLIPFFLFAGFSPFFFPYLIAEFLARPRYCKSGSQMRRASFPFFHFCDVSSIFLPIAFLILYFSTAPF